MSGHLPAMPAHLYPQGIPAARTYHDTGKSRGVVSVDSQRSNGKPERMFRKGVGLVLVAVGLRLLGQRTPMVDESLRAPMWRSCIRRGHLLPGETLVCHYCEIIDHVRDVTEGRAA